MPTKALALAIAATGAAFLSASPARADSCVDLRTNTVYDCAGKPSEQKGKAKAVDESANNLRQRLRDALAKADAREKARLQKLQAAIAAAGKACASGDMKGFGGRMASADKLATEDERAGLESLQQACDQTRASAPAETAAEAPRPDADEDAPGRLPQFGDGDRQRERIWAKLSPRCKALLNRLMKGADTGDKEALLSSYGQLRADCEAELQALAKAAESDLPERRLSPRASGALAKAMSSDPNKLIEAIPDRAYDASFDPGEVADFALGLLGAMPSMRGFYTPTARGLAASYSGGVYRAGSAYRAPRTGPSTITGGSR